MKKLEEIRYTSPEANTISYDSAAFGVAYFEHLSRQESVDSILPAFQATDSWMTC